MTLVISQSNVVDILDDYRSFHDADIKAIKITSQDTSCFLCIEIILIAKNVRLECLEVITLLLHDVRDVKLLYNIETDYPSIRDDIAIGFYNNLVFLDFGSASEVKYSPDDFKDSYNYFVCKKIEISSERLSSTS